MPAAYPEEFRRRAVSLVADEGVPAARVAKDLGSRSRDCDVGSVVTWSRRGGSPG
jgi:hypothetical protein